MYYLSFYSSYVCQQPQEVKLTPNAMDGSFLGSGAPAKRLKVKSIVGSTIRPHRYAVRRQNLARNAKEKSNRAVSATITKRNERVKPHHASA